MFSKAGNYFEKISESDHFSIAFRNAIGDKYTIAVTNNTNTKERNDDRNGNTNSHSNLRNVPQGSQDF